MSLVSQLLEGANAANATVDISMYDFSRQAVAESSYFDAACVELYTDIMECDRLEATADIIGGVKVVHEGADPAVVMESVVSGGIAKLKAGFAKFLAKIKAFFEKVKQYFKSVFLRGSKFVKEFKVQLNSKDQKGFKITGYLYDIGENEGGNKYVSNAEDVIAKHMAKLVAYGNTNSRIDSDSLYKDDNGKANYNDGSAQAASNRAGKDEKYSETHGQEAVIKEIAGGCESIAELRTEVMKAYHNGAEDKEEVEPFTKNSVGTMCDFITGYEKKVATFNKEYKAFETYVNQITKALDKWGSDQAKNVSADDASGSDNYKNASKVSTAVQSLLNLYKTVVDMQIAAYKEANNSFEATLKNFLHWKKPKEASEGVTPSDAPEADEDTSDAQEDAMPQPNNGDFDPDPNIAQTKECGNGKCMESALFEEAAAWLR